MNDKSTMTEHRDCRCGWTLPRDMKITVSTSDPETTAALTFSCPVCGRSGGIQTTKTVIQAAPKEKAAAATWNGDYPETKVMYVLVADDDAARFNGSHEVIGRSANSYFIQRDPRRDTREVDAVVKSYLDIERAWKNYLAGNTSPTLANYNPPRGFIHSREFGLGEVVCANGTGPYEVTIDTHRGERKTFTWDPTHDRKVTPRESATMAHRVALTMRQKWMTDGFGRPTAAYVEACGVEAARWVEGNPTSCLSVDELVSAVRARIGGATVERPAPRACVATATIHNIPANAIVRINGKPAKVGDVVPEGAHIEVATKSPTAPNVGVSWAIR